jgi:hypothetical protein
MKGDRAIIFGIMGIFLLAAFAPMTVGENDSLHIVLTVPDQEYRAESMVTVTLYVYDGGQPADIVGDADNITLTVREHYGLGQQATSLTPEHQSTGVYTATYTITDENHLYFYCEVTSGTDHEVADTLHIQVTETDFSVDVNFDGQEVIAAQPGDVITGTIEVRYGHTPVNVDGFDELYVHDSDGQEQALTETLITTGIYEVTYTLPMTMTSGVYELYANPEGTGAHDSAMIYINVLDVWYHRLSAIGQTVTFEVCVSDLEGRAVSGASLAITRGNWPYDTLTGNTNDTGKVLLSFTNVGDTLPVTGYVLSGGYNQSIQGDIINPQADAPNNNGLDIIWTGTDYYLSPGRSVTVPYTAYYDATPLNGQTICYYVTAWGTDYGLWSGNFQAGHIDAAYEVVASDTATTSATGAFNIDFTTPSTQCLLQVNFEVPLDSTHFTGQGFDQNDGYYYDCWPEYGWDEGSQFYVVQGDLDSDSGVKIKASKFKMGQESDITVTVPADNDDYITAYWGAGEWDMDSQDYNPEWMNWVPCGSFISLSENEEGELVGSYLVPDFLDIDDVTIIAGYMDGDTGFPHYNLKTVGRDTGGFPLLWIIVIVVIVLVVLALLLVMKFR